MADIPFSPTPPPSPIPTPSPIPGPNRGGNVVKVVLALLLLVVIVWFGRDAVVSLFRGEASDEQVDVENIPPQVICAPATQTVRVGQPAILTASGGDPTDYKWYAPQGEPFTQLGAQARVTYDAPGQRSVVLVSRVVTARCEITVTQ
ncbi:MAG: hypothetical protein AAB864_02725 [Patescibacteria group bacterium]